MKKELLIIDGHNLLFKMYYGMPNSIQRNNVEIKGVLGFISVILKLYNFFKPYNILVVFDGETSREENQKIDASYKSNRPDLSKFEYNPFTQLPMIKDCLNYLKIPNFEAIHYEADDYIASLCEQFQIEYSIVIVSTDKDFCQLINENICVYKYYGKKSILFNEQKVIEKYGITPEQFPMYLSIIGDQVDHILGIRGIGPKRARKLLNTNDLDFLANYSPLIEHNLKLVSLNKKLNIPYFNMAKLNLNNVKTNQVIDEVLKSK